MFFLQGRLICSVLDVDLHVDNVSPEFKFQGYSLQTSAPLAINNFPICMDDFQYGHSVRGDSVHINNKYIHQCVILRQHNV